MKIVEYIHFEKGEKTIAKTIVRESADSTEALQKIRETFNLDFADARKVLNFIKK